MQYFMPKAGILSLHSSSNEGLSPDGVSFFFVLIARPNLEHARQQDRNCRKLELHHCWSGSCSPSPADTFRLGGRPDRHSTSYIWRRNTRTLGNAYKCNRYTTNS